MSIESFVFIDGIFPNDELAKEASSKLKRSLDQNEHELASSLHSLYSVENQIDYKNDTINVEDTKRKKNSDWNTLSLDVNTYGS